MVNLDGSCNVVGAKEGDLVRTKGKLEKNFEKEREVGVLMERKMGFVGRKNW